MHEIIKIFLIYPKGDKKKRKEKKLHGLIRKQIVK